MDINIFIQNLDKNTKDTLHAAKNCSPEQLRFRENGKWSILQILEHICITDRVIHKIILKPSDNLHDTHELVGDARLKKILVDLRARRIESPEMLRPQDVLPDFKTFEKLFVTERNLLKQNLQTGRIVVDNRIHKHPFLDNMTIVDWLNFLIHHTQRHLEQIKENLKQFQVKENQQL